MFNLSIQFIFSHILTSDKLEPFERLLFTIINVSIEFVAHYETLRNKLQKPKTKILLVVNVGSLKKNYLISQNIKKKIRRPKTG